MKLFARPCRGNLIACQGRSWLLAMVLAVLGTAGSQAVPRIGYIYPAGGQTGSSFECTIGGQGLSDPLGIIVSGEGVTAEVLDHFRLLPADERQEKSEKLPEIRDQVREMLRQHMPKEKMLAETRRLMAAVDITEKNILQMREFSDRLGNPRRQPAHPQIGESVKLRVKVSPKAEAGLYYLRLLTATGLSNPMRFAVGQFGEVIENEAWPLDLLAYFGAGPVIADVGNVQDRWERVPPPLPTQDMPITINGVCLPGELDEFTFRAKAGDKVVLALQARKLVPYLADAVPGWFQAVLSLHDDKDNELAYADDFRFDPDPVIFYKIPKDGVYRVKIHDSIYRGREDFVYRLTIGQLPFLTGLYPLGAKAGTELDVNFQGGNLTDHLLKRYKVPETPGLVELFASNGTTRSNFIPFHVDNVPEEAEREPNDRRGTLNEVACPGIINGTISKPGDVDFFRVPVHSKSTVFEVFARRLGSPLDATLTAFDDAGKPVAFNDDYEDPTAGLTPHHADSRIVVSGTGAGSFYVKVADRMGQGSVFHHYRLKVSPARPNFALRVTPSSLSARPGGGAQITVHALRIDGFDGEISLRLKDAPEGFRMPVCTVPAGKDKATVGIQVPGHTTEFPVAITVQGTAQVEGKDLVVDAVPAEDMMQAFFYQHLVPMDSLRVDVRVPPDPPVERKKK